MFWLKPFIVVYEVLPKKVMSVSWWENRFIGGRGWEREKEGAGGWDREKMSGRGK